MSIESDPGVSSQLENRRTAMPLVGAIVVNGPHPSLAVVRSWQGIVELVIRAVAVLSVSS